MGIDVVVFTMAICDRLAQRRQTLDREIVLLRSVRPQGLDHRLGHRERRLAQTEVEHLAARGAQPATLVIDRQRGRLTQAANIEIEADRFDGIHLAMLHRTPAFGRRFISPTEASSGERWSDAR